MTVTTDVYNKDNGITQYTLSNKSGGLTVKIIDYGATITNVLVKDKTGKQRDVVLGWDDLDGYLGKNGKNPYFGASIGRFANRIANGKFSLNGKTYELALNNGPSSLHGGLKGFDKKKWDLIAKTDNSVNLGQTAEDGEEGYPGQLKVSVTYSVTEDNELILLYSAKLAEKQTIDTILNLTNHTYFNLNGCTDDNNLDVLTHKVKMTADHYLDVNADLQPTGKILSTKTDSPSMDFTTEHTVGERISEIKPNGYDHCYVIETNEKNFDVKGGDTLREAVVVSSPTTGITLTFSTTEPGFQFYTGNNVTDEQKTKTSQSSKQLGLRKNSGLCLEASRFPDAINKDNWKKQVILAPNQEYSQTTVYKFGVSN